MPRVIKRTPEWLVPPSPGHSLFSASPKASSVAREIPIANNASALRTIAKGRGSEVFVAVGNELRWADLGALKRDFAEVEDGTGRSSFHYAGDGSSSYRVLKIPGAGPITALSVSPQHDFLAIQRAHTLHLALLPDPRHLHETDLGPYKLKTFHLGPTTHCIEESPLMSTLWHPLGAGGTTLVTTTADAVIRLWELSPSDRSTFDTPSLAIDLKKLANATDASHDFSASKFGSAKGFTPDSVELEPAAVCFGGRGAEGENPWHACTLWLATKGGDVYTLCPLLPRRFEVPAEWLEDLAALVAAKTLEAEEGDRSKLVNADAQREFLDQLREQERILAQGASEFEARYVYARPSRPGAPKLQGPFEIDPELEEESEFADIYVAPFETPSEQGFDEEQELPGSSSLVCILTNRLEVLVTIDFDGVDGMWLPARGTPFSTPRNRSLISADEYKTLTLFEAIQLPWSDDAVRAGPPSFTPDVVSPHAFFVTSVSGVHYVSAARWIRGIQNELADSEAQEGSNVRMDILLDSARSLVETPISFSSLPSTSATVPTPSSAILFVDAPHGSGLGYFLLTTRAGEPFAAQLDIADSELSALHSSGVGLNDDIALDDYESYSTFSVNPANNHKLVLAEPREIYRPDPIFAQASTLPNFITQQSQDRKVGSMLRAELDLESTATLEVMIQAHKRVQGEYDGLNRAAAALFAQSERLRSNLVEQIRRARELREKVDAVTGADDDDDDQEASSAARRQERIEEARERQRTINERLERLKGRLGGVSTRSMSDKEKAWAKEVEELDRKIVTGEIPGEDEDGQAATSSSLMDRVMRVTQLKEDLVKLAKEAAEEGAEGGEVRSPSKRGGVPTGFRKARVQNVMELLEREQVLVERAAEKFGRLKVA